MKKNKKDLIDVIPEGEKLLVEHEKGSVGEFIELLKEFPADGKIDLNGSIHISKDAGSATIYPREIELTEELEDKLLEDECKGCAPCGKCCGKCACELTDKIASERAVEAAKESYADRIAGKFCLGFDHCNPEMISTFRSGPADKLLGAPIMTPNTGALEYEENYLLPNQVAIIDEIRHHNVYMAEAMAELCRRGISAMLEYNTQILSHFARETTKDMCVIIDKGTAGEVAKCLEDEEF